MVMVSTALVGDKIQTGVDNQSIGNATIKRGQMIHTLNDLKPGVKVDKETIQIDPTVLFLRCTALAQPEDEDITGYFAHEMTAVPTSMFKDSFMRKIDKSELGRTIKKDLNNILSFGSYCDL